MQLVIVVLPFTFECCTQQLKIASLWWFTLLVPAGAQAGRFLGLRLARAIE